MNNNTTQKESGPSLCQKCFSFYGAPQTQNLCSKCFKQISEEQQNSKQQLSETQEKETQTLDKPQENLEVIKKVDSSKCNQCEKKIGIRGFKCKCEYFFCKKHRIPENHNCDFNFKAFEKDKLSQNNKVCMADKINKF